MLNDRNMTAVQLREKYGSWAEHPTHSTEDWQYEVSNDDTRSGYWDWVAAQLELDEE